MSRIARLLHTQDRVNDLVKTLAFYRNIPGLRGVNRHKSPRGLAFIDAPEGYNIELMQRPKQ